MSGLRVLWLSRGAMNVILGCVCRSIGQQYSYWRCFFARLPILLVCYTVASACKLCSSLLLYGRKASGDRTHGTSTATPPNLTPSTRLKASPAAALHSQCIKCLSASCPHEPRKSAQSCTENFYNLSNTYCQFEDNLFRQKLNIELFFDPFKSINKRAILHE